MRWPPRKQRSRHAKREPESERALPECVCDCIDTVAAFDTCTDSSTELDCLCQSTIDQDAVQLCVNFSCDQNDDDALNSFLDRCSPNGDTSSDSPDQPPSPSPNATTSTSQTPSRCSPTGAPSGTLTPSVTSQSNSTNSIPSKASEHPITASAGHSANATLSSLTRQPFGTTSSLRLNTSTTSTTSIPPSANGAASTGHNAYHHPRTAMIVVSSLLGSLLLIALIAALVLCIRRYRRRRVRTPSRLEPFLLLPSASTSFDGDRRRASDADGGSPPAGAHLQPELKSRRASAITFQCDSDDDNATKGAALAPIAPNRASRCSLSLSSLFSPSHVLHICAPPAQPRLGALAAAQPSLSSLSSLSRRAQNGAPSESVLVSPAAVEMRPVPVHLRPPGLAASATTAASVSDLSDLSRRAQRGANSESGMSVELLAGRRAGDESGDSNGNVQMPCVAYVPRASQELARRAFQEKLVRAMEIPAVAY
ncbi:hypothetical protein GY45DRAFT_320760 [Cubamyces sp. BRFM 1775]|nr:hypothetical protein GY45DRAFT_320760 [Cubamyces sp. BRFM 1775]